jgi:hypothetical protein
MGRSTHLQGPKVASGEAGVRTGIVFDIKK